MITRTKVLLLSAALSLPMQWAAAQNDGGITPEMMKKIETGYQASPANKAIRNAIGTNDIHALALNQENLKKMDTHFSIKVNSKGITDQHSSGRCWLFTGLNVMRAKMIAHQHLANFEFSQNFCFFYDQLEKSNLFLQGIIDTKDKPLNDKMVEWLFRHPLSDGGQFTGISDVITKYGLVPKGAMPETFSSNNTRRMNSLVSLKLKEFGLELRDMKGSAKKINDRKTEMLGTVYHMLAITLGVPPTSFEWKGKEYTPVEFYNTFINDDLKNNYVMLMNDPTREYHKCYEIDYDRHVYDGKNWTYINLPIEEIKEMAIASLKDSTMMYFSCDVGKCLNAKRGLLDVNNYDYGSLMGTTFGMNKKQRVQTFASGSTHAMTLMAVDLDKSGKINKWMVENSWGPSHGFHGHLIMTDQWFNEYMFRLVVNKKYVPSKTMKILNKKPIRLPAWDPMFQNEL